MKDNQKFIIEKIFSAWEKSHKTMEKVGMEKTKAHFIVFLAGYTAGIVHETLAPTGFSKDDEQSKQDLSYLMAASIEMYDKLYK